MERLLHYMEKGLQDHQNYLEHHQLQLKHLHYAAIPVILACAIELKDTSTAVDTYWRISRAHFDSVPTHTAKQDVGALRLFCVQNVVTGRNFLPNLFYIC